MTSLAHALSNLGTIFQIFMNIPTVGVRPLEQSSETKRRHVT